ncbi:MAG: acetate kinase [Paracoccaceae bacterium]|jgi:acetate kinase
MPDRRILTINAGSSSLKFGLYGADGAGAPLATGQVSGIGGPAAMLEMRGADPVPAAAPTPAAALACALAAVTGALGGARVAAVGHRIVHGGEGYGAPVLLTPDAMATLAGYERFAPLHQPHNLAGVRAAAAAFPNAVQVGCFDTAFHRTMAFEVESYGLPRAMHARGIHRYGFHGLSYQAIARVLAAERPDLLAGRVIVAHLGSGASMCAMQAGRSVATTMGFSPLDGLVMATRCGHLDPGVLLHLMEAEGMTAHQVSDLLYRGSGLKGLSGETGDMRALLASGSDAARDALAVWVYRARREVGSLAAALQGVDAVVFTAGIGERSAEIRARICGGLGWLGAVLDPARNEAGAQVISADGSAVALLAIPTDEEGVIARAAAGVLEG